MVKLKTCILPFLFLVWASLTGVLGADELPPQIEARLLEARARAAASVGDLATAEVLFKKSLQIGGNEISPDGLIRILLLNQSYDEVASTAERYGTAMPESERKVLAEYLKYRETGAVPDLDFKQLAAKTPELALYTGLLLEADGKFEQAYPFLVQFLEPAQWGSELAGKIVLENIELSCQMCLTRNATSFETGTPVCAACQLLLSDPTWVRQSWSAPTDEQRVYMKNLLGELADAVQETYLANTPEEMQKEIPLSPLLELSKLLAKLDPETAELWRRAEKIAMERGRVGPGTGDLGLALTEGKFDPRRFSSEETQKSAYREAENRPDEVVGEQGASQELLWLLNEAHWLSQQLPPYNQTGIKTRDVLWAYDLTERQPKRHVATSVMVLIGDRLGAEQSDYLEQLSTERPDELFFHLVLSSCSRFDFRPVVRERALRHTLWLIENKPLLLSSTPMSAIDKRAHQLILEAWNDKLRANPNRAEVLAAAAEFYNPEIQNLAAALLSRAMELEPDNLEWKKQNAFLQELMDENDPDTDQEQLEVAEESLRQATEAERGSLMTSLVMTAYDAGAHERASEVARELLSQPQDKEDWNSGNAFHKSHLVLGLIALEKGDVEAAKQHLLASAETQGSPQLNSFGPNMRLAEALLIEGERDTVLKYLDLCSNFWGSPYIKQWSEEIEAGEVPDFGANLRY